MNRLKIKPVSQRISLRALHNVCCLARKLILCLYCDVYRRMKNMKPWLESETTPKILGQLYHHGQIKRVRIVMLYLDIKIADILIMTK